MIKKKALLFSSVLTILLSVIVLIIILFFSYSFFENPQKKYAQSGLLCTSSFSNIPASFENKTALEEYFKISSQMCISKTVETNDVVREVANLIETCWYRSGGGKDFLPTKTSDLSVCVYCGSVIPTDEGVFSSNLVNLLKFEKYSPLFDSTGFENSNINYLLDNSVLPEKYIDNKEIGVFFYLARAEVESGCGLFNTVSDCTVKFSRFLRENSGLIREVSNILGNKVPSIGGILLTEFQRSENLFENEIKIYSENDQGNLNCDILVLPDEHIIVN